MFSITRVLARMADAVCARVRVVDVTRDGARASAARHVHGAIACAVALAFSLPSVALADVGDVVGGPVSLPDGSTLVVVEATNKYNAAAYVLGYSMEQVNAWDSVARAKLSNPDFGGRFYEFAQGFYSTVDAGDGVIASVTNALGAAFWTIAETLYGSDNLIVGIYNTDQLSGAKEDLQTILDGGNVGGGGGTLPDDGTYVTLPFTLFGAALYSFDNLENGPVYASGNDGNFAYKLGTVSYYLQQYTNNNRPPASDFAIRVPKSFYTALLGAITSTGWDDAKCLLRLASTTRNQYTLDGYIIHGDLAKRYVDKNGFFVGYSYPNGTEYYPLSLSYAYVRYPDSWPTSVAELSNVLVASSSIRYQSSYKSTFSNSVGVIKSTYTTASILFDASGYEGDNPVVPPSQWPEEPSAPEPPELPNPTSPTVEPPEPYEPSGGDTYIWNITNVTEPTDTTDIIEWLKKIFYELKAMHADLQDWLENLSSGQVSVKSAIDNAASQLYGAIGDLSSDVSAEFTSLKAYLRQLFDWIGQKLTFNSAGYDDSSVIYWLRRIWSKLGGGINTRPVDPTVDPTGVWDWLLRLIQNFTLDLAASANDLISELGDLISQVITMFPFSIPWDIALFLTAMSAQPVTPNITFTIPSVFGLPSYDVAIDLSPFDGAAAVVRLFEKFVFAGFLVWKSRELLDFMDPSGWVG